MVSKFKSHPWHGIDQPDNFPTEVLAFIEIIPADTVKYEIDKGSGYLKIDRPQKFSNQVPALYGFIPKTFCGKSIAHFSKDDGSIKGDGDPLDILVLTERVISHGDILVSAIPIGGFTMLDRNEADDKIIAVMKNDDVYGKYKNISELPLGIINRLKHYFLTYKQMPNETSLVEIGNLYESDVALQIINASRYDYDTEILKF